MEEKLRFSGNAVEGVVTLPKGLSGTFVWKGAERPLRPGRNELSVGEDDYFAPEPFTGEGLTLYAYGDPIPEQPAAY